MIVSLVVTSLGSASVERVGARDTDRLEDVVERDAAVIAAGGGARVALVLVQELVMARRTDHVPDRALEDGRPERVIADGAVQRL